MSDETWCCPLCGSDDEFNRQNLCLHMLEGDIWREDGTEVVYLHADTPPAIPTWACEEAKCPELLVCGECASNLPAQPEDIERALAAIGGDGDE